LPDTTGLTFDPEVHRYMLNDMVVPSVTQIIKGGGLFGDFTKFVDEEALKHAMELGTAAHLATQYYDEKRLDMDALSDEVRPFVDAWARFRMDTGVNINYCEVKVCHREMMYAGTVDRIVRWKNGTAAIIDIKTGVPQKWHAIQTYAYARAYAAKGRVIGRYSVYLDKEANYKVVEHKDGRDGDVWNACLTLHRWKQR